MRTIKLFLVLALLLLKLSALAQWNNNIAVNNPVCLQNYDQQDARIITDGSNGAIITWLDHRNDSIAADIFCQRINKSGYPVWLTNGVAICTDPADQGSVNITESNDGGAIIVWSDKRNGINNTGIYIQKIDSNGNIQWAQNGVNAVLSIGIHQNPKILSDGQGGAFILFEDSSTTSNFNIVAQHISSTGQLIWGNNGIMICNSTNKQINPRIETDGNGGFYAVWQDLRNGNDYDIYIQNVSSNGFMNFNINGIPVCTSSNVQSNPKIEPDGQNGAIVAWVDKRNNTDYDIYSQRINSTGTMMWNTNGIAICTAANNQSAIELKSLGTNGIIYAWKDSRKPTASIYCDRFNLNGISQWATNGNLISTGINPNLADDYKGGVILTWQDSVGISWNVYNTRLNVSGAKVWGGNVIVCNAVKAQISPKNIGDGLGGAITCWQDKRNTNDYDIFCQHTDSNSVPNKISEIVDIKKSVNVFPNPSSKFFNIYNLEKHKILAIKMLTITGQEVESFEVYSNDIQIKLPINQKINDGTYILNILFNDGSIETSQLIVAH